MLGDRRRILTATPLLAVVLVGQVLPGPAAPAAAQGFGWGYFDAPSPRRRAPRRRTAPPPAPRSAPVETPDTAADVPLPVPRPRFPGDPPAPAVVETATPKPSDAKPSAADKGAASQPGKPEPPKPEPAKPEPVKPEPKPPEVASPKPAEPAIPGSGAPPPPVVAAPVPPPKPPELAAPPVAPGIAPSGARLGEAPGQPVEDPACPGRLKAREVEAEPVDIGPQPDPRCSVVQAVRIKALALPDGGRVEFPERPTLACTTADTFSLYIRDLLSPLAKGTFSAPVTAIWTGPGLSCRSRDHILGAKLSSHGQGLAIDIGQVKLANGRLIEIGKPASDKDQGFQTAARAAGCGYFHTALGPGTDAFHATHWHFDLEVRGAKGDSKYCR